MTVIPHPTSVLVVGDDDQIRSAVARLLSHDPAIIVAEHHPLSAAPMPDADVVVDEGLLHDLESYSLKDFIAAVKALGGPMSEASTWRRHLRPLPGKAELTNLLSARELQVVRLVAEGLSNKEISLRLALSDKTVKNHISHILAKMQLTARTQVAVHALRAGLV